MLSIIRDVSLIFPLKILGKNRKAKLADTLIAQSCLDHGASLVARDHDFNIFKQVAGLRIF